jgi:hypothetical protein
VNCLKPTGSRAFDVRKDIVEEKNATGWHSNRLNNKLECLGVRLSQPDFVRQKYFLEMTYEIAKVPRPIQMVCLIGVREGVLRDSLSHLGEQAGNARHFADKDRIPSIKKLLVRDVNSKRDIRRLSKYSSSVSRPVS